MTTTTIPTRSKLNTLNDIQREMRLFRSFIISVIGKDKEGKYNQKFVKEILKTIKENPTRSFSNTKTFLEELSRL